MSKQDANVVRVTLTDLPPREERITDERLDPILHRIAGQEGMPCKRTCDCAFGLVCLDGVCTVDW